MAGFPTRPNKDSFGSDLVDERPVQDPTKEIAAAIFNLKHWQIAGVGIVAAKAVLVATVVGGVVTTVDQLLAFDPTQAVSLLTWTYNGVGDFSLDFAQQYPNELGVDTNLALVGGIAVAMGATPRLGSVDLTSGYEMEVYFLTDAGAGVDPAKFVLILW